jgi:ligand-binding sensor domain-containing protein
MVGATVPQVFLHRNRRRRRLGKYDASGQRVCRSPDRSRLSATSKSHRVWAGTLSGGVSVLRHGVFKTYDATTGLQSNAVFSSMQAADGKMWLASPSGLMSFDGTDWMTYRSQEADAVPNVRTVFEDANRMLWIGTSHGLARLVHGHIEVPHNLPQVLSEEVGGIGQDSGGFLWIASAQHVLQIDPAKLRSGTLGEHDVLSYGVDDGLTETEGVSRDRSLVSDSFGRIWLSRAHSIAVADANSAKGYRVPVRARIDSISLEDGAVERLQNLELPPEIRSVGFRYSGTNLSLQLRTLFRYRLDGLDQSWSTDALSRQVVFTHLTPGHYRFRLVASNAVGRCLRSLRCCRPTHSFTSSAAIWNGFCRSGNMRSALRGIVL